MSVGSYYTYPKPRKEATLPVKETETVASGA